MEKIEDGVIKKVCNGLNDNENEILDNLVEAWNLFITLPDFCEFSNVTVECFVNGMNGCQTALSHLALARQFPEGWNK